jgi:hypothetical protein
MIYINEAHAVDVWPIGLSAGTINYSHKNIGDRAGCATKFKSTFNFDIPIYLDSMSNEFDEMFSVWPFRYYVIEWSKDLSNYVFTHIPNPSDSEFDLTELISLFD